MKDEVGESDDGREREANESGVAQGPLDRVQCPEQRALCIASQLGELLSEYGFAIHLSSFVASIDDGVR